MKKQVAKQTEVTSTTPVVETKPTQPAGMERARTTLVLSNLSDDVSDEELAQVERESGKRGELTKQLDAHSKAFKFQGDFAKVRTAVSIYNGKHEGHEWKVRQNRETGMIFCIPRFEAEKTVVVPFTDNQKVA